MLLLRIDNNWNVHKVHFLLRSRSQTKENAPFRKTFSRQHFLPFLFVLVIIFSQTGSMLPFVSSRSDCRYSDNQSSNALDEKMGKVLLKIIKIDSREKVICLFQAICEQYIYD